MRRLALGSALVALAIPCFAQAQVPDMFPKDPIGDLATILASEEMCGLELSIPAVEAYVEIHLPEEGGMAVQRVNGATTAVALILGQPTGALLAAHCAGVVKIAEHLKLTKDTASN